MAATKAATLKRSNEDQLMHEILGLYCELSPENLWQDGEATEAQARKAHNRLWEKLDKCFAKLGREVSESEAMEYGLSLSAKEGW